MAVLGVATAAFQSGWEKLWHHLVLLVDPVGRGAAATPRERERERERCCTNPAMTLPSTTPPRETTNPTARASASSPAVAGADGRVRPKSCHRPKIKQLKAVTRPPYPTAQVGAALGAKPKRMSRSEREQAAKITRPCSECGRRFWSWKALFGHMRCHPNRPWRGIEPPSDCAPRGPARVGSSTDHAPANEGGASEAEVEVASCLILLKGEQTDGTAGDELSASRGFSCSSCGKVFDAPTSLGGHRASHAKSRRPDAATRKRKAEEGVHEVISIQLHRCAICSTSFSSGQALGGGDMSSPGKESDEQQVAASEGASSSSSRAGGCGFDLNLPAAGEMQQGAFFPCSFGIDSDLKLPADGLVP